MFPSPALAVPSLANFQLEYNGLLMGANTPYGVLKSEGLFGISSRSGDVPLPRDYGETPGLDTLGGQDPILDLWVNPDSGQTLQGLQVALAAATRIRPNEEIPLWFQLPNLPVMCRMCRPRSRKGAMDFKYASGSVWEPEVPFHATDPRAYGAGRSALVTAGATRGGGLTFPVVFPVTFGATEVATIEAANEGNMEMRPLLLLSGGTTGAIAPSVTNASIDGEPTIQIAIPSGAEPTIAAGDQVLIYLGDPHLALYYPRGIESGEEPDDIASWLTASSEWWDLPAETTSRVEFRVASGSGATCELQWAPAWTL